jgi:hypothetical protein
MDKQRDLAEWDAEIEADFQRAVAATKAAGRRKRGQRLLGAPVAYVAEVCRATTGRAAVIVAVLVYRRTCVCNSRTIALLAVELTELCITRSMKRKALVQLEAAGLIRIERETPGRAGKVTLLWKPQ